MKTSIEDIIYTPPLEPSLISFEDLFGNDRAVELEIGTGKGGFLLEQARAHPERNYLGIEWANKIYRYAAGRMARWGLHNVRMCRTDARLFLTRYVPPRSLAALHVYHPDPWPKKRHHKRRLFNPECVAAVARVLRDGGTVSYQTDHAEYGAVIAELLAGCPDLERTLDAHQNEDNAADVIATNFQIKYRREGRDIQRQVHRRRPRS